jgi:excisionase family DNA binding protein
MTNQLPFDPDDFSLQARSALGALQHAMQVVINAGALLEQELGHPLNPPAPRRFLYPRAPEKTRTDEPGTDEPGAGCGSNRDEEATDTPGAATRACLLQDLHDRPPSARFTTKEAAVYLNCSTSLLRSWRWQGRGPPHEGTGRLVRYTKANLDRFMAT